MSSQGNKNIYAYMLTKIDGLAAERKVKVSSNVLSIFAAAAFTGLYVVAELEQGAETSYLEAEYGSEVKNDLLKMSPAERGDTYTFLEQERAAHIEKLRDVLAWSDNTYERYFLPSYTQSWVASDDDYFKSRTEADLVDENIFYPQQ